MTLSLDKQRTLRRLRASTLEQNAEKAFKSSSKTKDQFEARALEDKASKLSSAAINLYRSRADRGDK